MINKPTDELDDILMDISPREVEEYLRENKKYMADEEMEFSYYMRTVLDNKGIRIKDVCSFAGVNYKYGDDIINLRRHPNNRDLVIRLCVAGHFTVLETNRALKLYGVSPLYSKEKRDVCIIVAINNRMYDFTDIDDYLESHGCMKLSVNEI